MNAKTPDRSWMTSWLEEVNAKRTQLGFAEWVAVQCQKGHKITSIEVTIERVAVTKAVFSIKTPGMDRTSEIRAAQQAALKLAQKDKLLVHNLPAVTFRIADTTPCTD